MLGHYAHQCLAAVSLATVVAAVLPGPVSAETYVPPASTRTDILLNPGWRFVRQDVAGAQSVAFDDSTWSVVNLPHTWNNLDGQDGGSNYYRGIGWYRTHYAVDAAYAGRRLFLKLDGANIVTNVYVNGTLVGEHRGGFAAFTYDVTSLVNIGTDNVIAVKVSNAGVADVPPQSGDFTFFGGLYRNVHLLVTDPLHISPLDYGSPGVYLKTTNVSAGAANLQVTTVLSNDYAVSRTAGVRAVVVDAAMNVVTSMANDVLLPAGSVSNVTASTVISNPHLWDGVNDPYLYQVFVEVRSGTTLTDWISQPLGFRWLTFDPNGGVTLNGHAYDLHGVNMHQDWLGRGWAIGDSERAANFALIKELGVTMLRLAHYQHHDYTYQLADRNGVCLWTEVPLVNGVGSGNFNANAEQQLVELIRQRCNHPSVICWGVFNEVSSPSADSLVTQLVQAVHREDPTRPATAASNKSITSAINWMPDITAFNEYFGWYGGSTADFATFLDNLHATYPARCVGISEYGAGASIWQHSEDPLSAPAPYGSPHPEEWQNKFHEDYWSATKQRPFLWCKLIWNLCDFAVDSRNEGDTPGRNDKGLVTYDRQVRKDAFYFYKANWTTDPMVYITGHTFISRTSAVTAKVYANCDSVELVLNGLSQGTLTNNGSNIFAWPVTLQSGTNTITAIGTKGGSQVTDSLIWIASPLPLSQGRPVTVSSFQSGNGASNGNDGSLSTRWAASDATYPQWWRVDLGSVQPVTKAVISWYNSATRAYKYRIEISDDDANYQLLVDNTANSTNGDTTDTFSASARYVRITVTGVSPTGGWAGFYECRIFNVGGSQSPAAPTGLAATAVSSDQIDLSWNASASATGYIVKRATAGGGPYAPIATAVETTSYSDAGLSTGTTYYYVVSAVNAGGESVNSSESAAATITPAPSGLTATPGHSQVTLNWTASPAAIGYNVKRATSPGGPYVVIAADLAATGFGDTGLTAATLYDYVVSALYTGGESHDSSEVSARSLGPHFDFDSENDVDQADLTTFLNCVTGPALGARPPACTESQFAGSDADEDGDVDQDDFGFLQHCLDSSNSVADPACR